jgi:hypothetical protein
MSMVFDSDFWLKKLRTLDYPIKTANLDVKTLRGQKALPKEFDDSKISKLYSDDFVEVVLVNVDKKFELNKKRSLCTRTAKLWKENRLIKPILLFTDQTESYAVIVPGKGISGEARILGLSDTLYRTDLEVLESMRFPGSPDNLSINYDSIFFPYQKVRDEFFEGYKQLYGKVEKAVKKDLKAESTSYAQRFLGRLMFLYFLQRKGWLKENKHFVDTIKDYKDLNKLFYESLNQEGIHGIPFLNGSLFEKEPYMSGTVENDLYPKMDKLFKEARTFFNGYNFAVDETSPLEVEVSIDPALIGTVFENMLPENERGAKGTFYTPTAEISFICRRAIANYLGYPDAVSEDCKTFIDGISKNIERLTKDKSDKEVREFRDRLLSLRVLDPAVGSGGFLLVMMQEIVRIIQEAEAIVGWKPDPEELKKKILPNLYGFDIEPEAIEIARLRLWLSLIIDQKEPEPLPNLDMSLIVIKDSLVKDEPKKFIDPRIEELREDFAETRAKYLNEHDSKTKKKLKGQLKEIAEKIAQKTGTDPNVIEAYMPQKAHLIVMNPPYVRQEAILQKKKDYYADTYSIGKKSDLFGYFLIRTLSLLTDDGVASVISSDKWLETDYGVSIQEKLKDQLIAIYGQKERSFGADINTVISVYSKKKLDSPLAFTYIESYSEKEVRRHIEIKKKELASGKWFYLRAPKIFLEKILPKLPLKLGSIAEVRFGTKTGANEFFFLKDMGHLFQTDYLSSPEKFEEWGISEKTQDVLEKHGLAYFENEGGHRFVLDQKDISPIVRSPTELNSYILKETQSFLFKPNPPNKPGTYSLKYIKWGEKQEVTIKKGTKKGAKIKGYNKLTTIESHRPNWFNPPDLEAANVIPNRFIRERHFTSYSKVKILASDACALAYSKVGNPINLWLYMNSTIFFLTEEIYGMRMGGGGAPLEILAGEYENFPAFNLKSIEIDENLLDRQPLKYDQEIQNTQRRILDLLILKAMGFEKPESLIDDLYSAFTEVVTDRIAKAGNSPKQSIIKEEGNVP